MEKVTYFDVEYANNKNKSICQIGIMCENFTDGEPFYPERDIYINPVDGFEDFCVRIHGITKDKVKDERTFPEVWKEIEKYFTNAVIIGHNVAGADLDALVKTFPKKAASARFAVSASSSAPHSRSSGTRTPPAAITA